MSENLNAELSKLRSDLAARKHDTERKPPKKPKSREGGGRKTSPAMKRRDGAKGEKDIGKGKLLVSSRGARPNDSTSTTVRKRKYSDPLNKRLKDLIACLLETRKDMTKEEICAAKQLDHDDGELWNAAMDNQRIEVLKEVGKFRYLPRHASVTDKGRLLMHVRRHARGTSWSEISDTYSGVEADLASLTEERKVFVIENPDMEDKVIFWNDPTYVILSFLDDVTGGYGGQGGGGEIE